MKRAGTQRAGTTLSRMKSDRSHDGNTTERAFTAQQRANPERRIFRILTMIVARLITLAAALGTLATAAIAQPKAPPAAEPATRGMAACRTDMATFCVGMEAGGGRRIACLAANKDKLSAECSAVLQQRAARISNGSTAGPTPKAQPTAVPNASALSSAPGSQVSVSPAPGSQVSGSPAPGSPASGSPASAASTDQPPASNGAAQTPLKRGGGRLAACRADLRSLCASVVTGGGAKIRCLTENQAKVSPACAETIAELKSAKQRPRN